MKGEISKVHCLALHNIQGIGGYTLRQLISYAGSPENVFKMPIGKLKKIPGIGPKISNSIRTPDSLLRKAEDTLKRAKKENTNILFYYEEDFPFLLKQVVDTPNILFVKGNAPLNNRKFISIVGTRNATNYGLDMVSEIISGIKHHNPVIVSGLAYGIDVTAHALALKHNLTTLAVMASGTNIIYPAVHRNIASKIVDNGALISEYPFDQIPDPKRFPARNRIIAGLSEATIVVEAAEKGGELLTADIANSYDREVLAVPGNINNTYSKGCNYLIKNNKAFCLTDPSDIEILLGWDSIKSDPAVMTYSDLDVMEKKVVNTLQKHYSGILLDELSWRSEIPLNKLASILLNLEFRGYVNSLPGKMYKLVL